MAKRKYTLDETVFEKIDTEKKAYWLGFLYADGCVCLNAFRSPLISLELQERDKKMVLEAKRFFNAGHPLFYVETKSTQQNKFRLSFRSSKIANDLIKLGCIPNKSLILKWPSNLPIHLEHHFIRGYFDGDGSIHSSITGRHKNPQFAGEFIGTKAFCESLDLILQQKAGLSPKKISKTGNAFRYSFSGNLAVKKLYKFLYANSTIFLKRKHNKMKSVFNYQAYN